MTALHQHPNTTSSTRTPQPLRLLHQQCVCWSDAFGEDFCGVAAEQVLVSRPTRDPPPPRGFRSVASCFLQSALLEVDWQLQLLCHDDTKTVRDGDGKVIFQGLTVAMGITTGTPDTVMDHVARRLRYSGAVMSESATVCALARGGEIALTAPALRQWRRSGTDKAAGLGSAIERKVLVGTSLETVAFVVPQALLSCGERFTSSPRQSAEPMAWGRLSALAETFADCPESTAAPAPSPVPEVVGSRMPVSSRCPPPALSLPLPCLSAAAAFDPVPEKKYLEPQVQVVLNCSGTLMHPVHGRWLRVGPDADTQTYTRWEEHCHLSVYGLHCLLGAFAGSLSAAVLEFVFTQE